MCKQTNILGNAIIMLLLKTILEIVFNRKLSKQRIFLYIIQNLGHNFLENIYCHQTILHYRVYIVHFGDRGVYCRQKLLIDILV